MNILLTTETYLPYITGVSTSTDNIVRFMINRGHKVTLVCPKPLVKGNVDLPKGLKQILVPSLPITFYNNNAVAISFLARKILEKEIKNSKFDVIHIQEPGSIGLTALSLARKYKIPTVGALHFIPEQIDRVLWGKLEVALAPIINLYVRYVYNKYDQIMTVSNFFGNFLRSIKVDRPINIISNGIDTNLYKPNDPDQYIRAKYGFGKDDVVFFFLGRLDRDKNVETIIRALPYTNKNIKLLVAGKGTEVGFLKNLVGKLKVADKIVWETFIPDSELPSLYTSIDAFCIMSPYEGQSIVTLQALSSGLPVIAANAGALPELVTDNENGFLVNTYDKKTLADKMNILESSRKLRERFGLESRRISLLHERSLALRKLERIYNNLINRQRPHPYKFY